MCRSVVPRMLEDPELKLSGAPAHYRRNSRSSWTNSSCGSPKMSSASKELSYRCSLADDRTGGCGFVWSSGRTGVYGRLEGVTSGFQPQVSRVVSGVCGGR